MIGKKLRTLKTCRRSEKNHRGIRWLQISLIVSNFEEYFEITSNFENYFKQFFQYEVIRLFFWHYYVLSRDN